MSITSNAQDYTILNNEINIMVGNIQFKKDSDKLLPQSDAALNVIKKYLDDKTYITTLRIESHTNTNNQQLSEKRALVICKKLIAMGVDCKRLIAVGFGNSKPVADNSTREGGLANERIIFANAALRGRAIGSMPLDGGGKVAADVCEQ
jgi:OOP family OmpA-OmpF porin